MDLKVFATVAGTVFIAELGDKTQLANLLFAADREVSKWTVFAGAAFIALGCWTLVEVW
jgi:putative Ca2+/H+ antiporter (TMEM165/GDT1 family)